MTVEILRKIIEIDEEKCNGCGACIDSCAEGALALVSGKARLVKEQYCDGLAACLKECPQGALRIVERNAAGFDPQVARDHQEGKKSVAGVDTCACAGAAFRDLGQPSGPIDDHVSRESLLSHWPIQLALVPPEAKFLENADVVLIADCVPFAYPDLHRDFLKDHSVLVACPKLDDAEAHLKKLTAILQKSQIKSLTVVHMEVPCCAGLAYLARTAIARSGKNVPLQEVTIGIRGNIQ